LGFVILRNHNKILDSITIAEILNQGHKALNADRYYNPRAVVMETFNNDQLNLATQQVYKHIQDPGIKADSISQANHKFWDLLDYTA
jgi:hypothetical protein